MVPKCLPLCKSQPKGIFPLATFHKVERLFLEIPCIFWEKTSRCLKSKPVTHGQPNTQKEPLVSTCLLSLLWWIWKKCYGELNIISTVRRRKKEIWREGRITTVGSIRSFMLKQKHLQRWLITSHSGGNPQATVLSLFETEAQIEEMSMDNDLQSHTRYFFSIWCKDPCCQSNVSTIFISMANACKPQPSRRHKMPAFRSVARSLAIGRVQDLRLRF